MGRGYLRDDYLRLVGELRAARPTLALTTDLIVGFPGESEEEFAETMELVEDVRFAGIFAFCYSPRPGTAALRLADPVAPEVAAERLQRLLEAQRRIQAELNRDLVGRRMEVLVTGWGKDGERQLGRTSCNRIVHFAATGETAGDRPGSIVPVRISRGLPHSLLGERLPGPAIAGDHDRGPFTAGSPGLDPIPSRTRTSPRDRRVLPVVS
jgi:tRNA-2-methylthio-N6-dimethylallyladenosine synthase